MGVRYVVCGQNVCVLYVCLCVFISVCVYMPSTCVCVCVIVSVFCEVSDKFISSVLVV